MNTAKVVSEMNEKIHIGTIFMAKWLESRLAVITNDWWNELVISSLEYHQQSNIDNNKLTKLAELDLAALIKITDSNWYDICSAFHMSNHERQIFRNMKIVRNNWAHCPAELPDIDEIEDDIDKMIEFFGIINADKETISQTRAMRNNLQNIAKDEDLLEEENSTVFPESTELTEIEADRYDNSEIIQNSIVYLINDQTKKGVVIGIADKDHGKEYQVFVDNEIKVFFGGQIALENTDKKTLVTTVEDLKCRLTAYLLKYPSSLSLYSLHSARIDFVPYQFRPALKLIKSDTPKLLIADSVGVGKTIEAGLILRELQAREKVESVLVICPKPLVVEEKWKNEMFRFDEDFSQLDGGMVSQIISDYERDGDWPDRHKKTIIPYSLFSENILFGSDGKGKKKRKYRGGLLGMDPKPQFDLVIVDEAHHVRNSDTLRHEGVKYFTDNAKAVIFLTATPVQNGNKDLFTLLNLLSPEIVPDFETFNYMAEPNKFINEAVRYIRAGYTGKESDALNSLSNVINTKRGREYISKNPKYQKSLEMVGKEEITREEKIELISTVEDLHSFAKLINRTRRQDIQDFCIRRSHTVEAELTSMQQEIYDDLMYFQGRILSEIHGGDRNLLFMMGTIRRQAASCLFGLVPFMKDIINRNLNRILDDPEDDEDFEKAYDETFKAEMIELANAIIEKTKELPKEDIKLEKLFKVISEKHTLENNKIIVFSTFKHTLYYLNKKMKEKGIRVAQIDGSIPDGTRVYIRSQFELPKEDENAIDILLFTEVGCEGLDYQFCDMLVNYDLPWNPMRIEQRIGRIDRRGQESEAVNIYNFITTGTIDADIYHRCLMKIGIFEESIGDCGEILGKIGKEIENIVIDTTLTEEERRIKLEQIADNELLEIKEMRRLEEEGKELFGFDLSNHMINQDLQQAENPWISNENLQRLIAHYLHMQLAKGKYILGEKKPYKTLRLSEDARAKLKADLNALGIPKSMVKNQWEKYLKGNQMNIEISFDSEYAKKNKKTMFITLTHPLVAQAASYIDIKSDVEVFIRSSHDAVKKGSFEFAIYAWDYKGAKEERKIIPVCENESVRKSLFEIIEQGKTLSAQNRKLESFSKLESLHYESWNVAKENYKAEMQEYNTFKLDSFRNAYERDKERLEKIIAEAYDEKIIRMRTSELETVEYKFREKEHELLQEMEIADIHVTLIAKGMVEGWK